MEQNLSAEEYQLRQQHQNGGGNGNGGGRPRTLSISPSLQLHQQQFLDQHMHRQASSKSKKGSKEHAIARELSDLVVYCQSVKFKGFGKAGDAVLTSAMGPNGAISSGPGYDRSAFNGSIDSCSMSMSGSPANYRKRSEMVTLSTGGFAARKTGVVAAVGGLKSIESTPSSSSGSLDRGLQGNSGLMPVLPAAAVGCSKPIVPKAGSDLSNNPIYKCSSIPESRAKTLCRKHPGRMLDLTETQLVRVYPAGMRIDSSNFNPVSVWSCGIQMVAMNYQTLTDANLHMHSAMFAGTPGYVLKPQVMWSPSHILHQRFQPSSKTQEGLHATQISLSVVSGQYVCKENYGASPLVEIEIVGIPRDCCKYKTKMVSRNALNPIWEETFEIEVHLPELAFARFTVVDVASNAVASQRVVPLTRLRPGYRHLRLHNELDQPLPLSQLFLCSQFLDGDLVDDDDDAIDHLAAEEGDVFKDSPVAVEDGELKYTTDRK